MVVAILGEGVLVAHVAEGEVDDDSKDELATGGSPSPM